MDVSKTISRFKRNLTARGYSEHTVFTYSRNLDQFQKHLESRGISDLLQVTRSVILDYQHVLSLERNAPETKAIKMRSVKRFFEYLVSENKLLINPTEGIVEVSRKNRKIGTVLTLAEMNTLLDQPDDSKIGIRNKAIMELLYSTGIRTDELLHLTVKDLNREDLTLSIRTSKGGNERVVPVGKRALTYVQRYLDLPLINTTHDKRLFINRFGETLSGGVLRAFLNRYQKKAGIKKRVSPHTFRRTCATHLLQNGADIRYIQKLLGHKDLKTTQAYTKVLSVDVKKIHEKTHPNAKDRKWTSKKE